MIRYWLGWEQCSPDASPLGLGSRTWGVVMSTDAIVLLKDDHKAVAEVFRKFMKKDTPKSAKGALVKEMIELLTAHTYIENECMYPAVRELLPDLEDDILESYEEHHVADVLLMELYSMDSDDERFEAKTTVLIESIKHHVEEEETGWFPKVREGLSRAQLQELGAQLAELKKTAPKSPTEPKALRKALDSLTA
jgi:hemerythrin superfamily protein